MEEILKETMETIVSAVDPQTFGLTMAAVAIVAYATIQYSKKKKGYIGKQVAPAELRHNLSPGPSPKQYVGLGWPEQEYARLASQENGANKIYLIAKLRGPRITRERLEYAAACIQRRHPLLRCRLTRINGTVVLEELADLKINIRVCDRKDAQTCRAMFHDQVEKEPLEIGDNAKSPHTLFLFQSLKPDPSGVESSEIAMDLAHFSVDGAGLAPLMHEVLYYTLDSNAEPPEYGAWPKAQDVSLAERLDVEVSLLVRRFRQVKAILYLIWVAISLKVNTLPRDGKMKPRDFSRLNSTHCTCETLNEAETEAFINRCKDKKVSVTAAITAAYLETLAEIRYEKQGPELFSPRLVLAADSRKLGAGTIPSTDLAPHVYALPAYVPHPIVWEPQNDCQRTWKLAGDVKEFVRDYLSRPLHAAIYAELIGFFFSTLPDGVDSGAPMLQASSWCANAPVLKRYADGTTVNDVELMQNMNYHSWINISIYTFVGKLNISMLSPTPRFKTELVQEAHERCAAKLRRMIES